MENFILFVCAFCMGFVAAVWYIISSVDRYGRNLERELSSIIKRKK